MSDNSIRQVWLQAERESQDAIKVKRLYIRINEGNMYDAVMFSQIMYWFGRTSDGAKRTRIHREGHDWIAKRHSDWETECEIAERTARRCISRIEKRGLIETKMWKFNGTPMLHIRVNWDVFDRLRQSDLTSEDSRPDPKGQVELASEVKSLTETTTETKQKDISDAPFDDAPEDVGIAVGDVAPTDGDVKTDEKPKPKTKPRTRDLMFDAVAGDIFGVTHDDQLKQMQADDKYITTAIGQFSNWLKKKSDAIGRGKSKQYVGYITAPAEPRHVKAFGAWLQTRLKGANMPRDPEKLIQWWRTFASEAAFQSKKRRVNVEEGAQDTMTPEQRQEAMERLQGLRQ